MPPHSPLDPQTASWQTIMFVTSPELSTTAQVPQGFEASHSSAFACDGETATPNEASSKIKTTVIFFMSPIMHLRLLLK
jgi:hypothetical protein